MLSGHLTHKETVTTDSPVASEKASGSLGEIIAGQLRHESPRMAKGRVLTKIVQHHSVVL